MKRILWPLLLILLLCGCATPVQDETTVLPETAPVSTEPRSPAGIYAPFSDLEIQTDGAVRYFLPESDCYGIRMMGNDILAFSGVQTTTLTRYAGEKLYAVASAQLHCRIDPEESSFQISSNGITYYNPNSREVIFLDNDLKEVRRLGMSEDMVGKPVLSSNRMQVYYCTADAIRVYDTTTGLDKLLKTISYSRQSVEDVLLNDTILRCSLVDDRGQEYTIFLSAETGELRSQILSGVELSTYGDCFYARKPEGIQELLLFGREGEEPWVLTPADPFARSWFLESAHSLVTATVTEESTRLDHYDLDSGLRTASAELPGGIDPKYVQWQPDTGAILVMAYDYMGDVPVILSWQKEDTPAEDETDYTGPWYTADAPDVEGLLECAEYARTIGEPLGISILVGLDAVENQPWDYTLEMEYQVSVVRAQLETLDRLLSNFPEGFFEQITGTKKICIVRSITGTAVSGSVEAAKGIQYWDGENAYVVLAAGESLEYAFFHEIFHVIDSKVLSDTRVYYYWHNLNPEGVDYYRDYTSYLQADNSRYLEDETRAFIDEYSLCYPSEDRARVMEYACNPGNAHYFQSEIMQNKLRTLCKGIREAFGLEDYPEAFLWEQYLSEPLVP